MEPLYIAAYFILINLIGFINMGIDKWKAKRGKWRISEWHLMVPGILGGILGVIVGMKVFHHKTRKTSFKIPIILIFLLNVGYWYMLYRYYL